MLIQKKVQGDLNIVRMTSIVSRFVADYAQKCKQYDRKEIKLLTYQVFATEKSSCFQSNIKNI